MLSLLLGTLCYSKEVELHSTNHEAPSIRAGREEEGSLEQVQDPMPFEKDVTSGLLASGSEDASLRYPLGGQENPRRSLRIRRFTRKWEPSAGSRMRNKIGRGRGRIGGGILRGNCAGTWGRGEGWLDRMLPSLLQIWSQWAPRGTSGGISESSEVGSKTAWYQV